MLVLSRHRDESIIINDDITVTVVDIRGDKVRLGVEAPNDVPVHRREVYEAIMRDRNKKPPERVTVPHSAHNGNGSQTQSDAPDENSRMSDLQAAYDLLLEEYQDLARTSQDVEVHIRELQSSILQLRQQRDEYQSQVATLMTQSTDLTNELADAKKANAALREEVLELQDCREILRGLGQAICGCDHVESRDERIQQTKHIVDSYTKLEQECAKFTVEYAKLVEINAELMKAKAESQNGVEVVEPTIHFCHKHSIVHTSTKGCYLCRVENESLRAANPRTAPF